jgi:hypothetical protein
LVAEEIKRLVDEALERGERVAVADCVAKLRARYPNLGMSAEQLAEEVAIAARSAGVTVATEQGSRGMPSEAC